MSGALVRVILNLLLADVTFNPFLPCAMFFQENSIFWGNANSTVSPILVKTSNTIPICRQPIIVRENQIYILQLHR